MLTMAVRKYDLNVPFGVVEGDGAYVRALVEKPLLNFLVNAGIYLLEPQVQDFLFEGVEFFGVFHDSAVETLFLCFEAASQVFERPLCIALRLRGAL